MGQLIASSVSSPTLAAGFEMEYVAFALVAFFCCAFASAVIALIYATAYWIYKKAGA